jgi:hypothetical protein
MVYIAVCTGIGRKGIKHHHTGEKCRYSIYETCTPQTTQTHMNNSTQTFQHSLYVYRAANKQNKQQGDHSNSPSDDGGDGGVGVIMWESWS